MPASKPADIRNIILLGHGGAGKTSLAEALLFAVNATTRKGNVLEGTSILDSSDIEKERQHSIDPAMCFLDYAGKTINILDAPGYPDFIGGALAALGGTDTAVITISATSGIEVNTRRMFRAAKAAGLPIAIVVTKIHGDHVDLEAIVKNIEETFGHTCHPLNLPVKGGSAVIDCFANASGESDFGDVSKAHEMLIDSVVESDEEMMEAYLGGTEIPADKLSNAFGMAMVEGTVIPMFFTSARDTVGITELLDGIVKYFPSPEMVADRPVMSSPGEDAQEVVVACNASKPFVGHAFKITSDPYVGKLAWIRVLQGTIKGDTHYHLRDEKKTAKIGHLFKPFGGETREVKSAVAGDIIALAKVEEIRFGDVLHEDAAAMYRKTPAMPTPMFSLAVEPKSRNDEQKISEALHRFVDEDPTFIMHRDAQTHETVMSGIGDLHLRMMLMKMKNRFHIEVDTKPPKIPYKETITVKADGHHRHKKQTGGAGQFGEVYLRVEPLERGAGFEFVSELFGESIPRQFLPAIQKGVEDVVAKGAIAGYPMQDIKVAVTDGKHHPVDSKEVAFKAAGKFAFIDAIMKAKPVLLEPIVDMEISVPAANMGDIASDLATRRGRIQGQEIIPGNMAVVKAQAPLSEVMQYNSQLRSITGGQGSYSMELSHYEPVPGNVQQQIVASAVKHHHEDE